MCLILFGFVLFCDLHDYLIIKLYSFTLFVLLLLLLLHFNYMSWHKIAFALNEFGAKEKKNIQMESVLSWGVGLGACSAKWSSLIYILCIF